MQFAVVKRIGNHNEMASFVHGINEHMKVSERPMDDCFDEKKILTVVHYYLQKLQCFFLNFNILFVLCLCCNK